MQLKAFEHTGPTSIPHTPFLALVLDMIPGFNRSPPTALTNKHESPVLNYLCSVWRRSSQIAANLYNQGCKLWNKNDLQDIEQEIKQSVDRKTFTDLAIDGSNGSIILIEKLNFGEQEPIW